MTDNPQIIRDGTQHIVRVGEKEKVFRNKQIYLPDEYELAVQNHLASQHCLVLAATGYSSVKKDNLKDWGLEEGQYEDACFTIISILIDVLKKDDPKAKIKIAHGASAMGVDLALMRAARECADGELGFSCPEYLLYVEDDDYPVYCATDKLSYSQHFIKSLDLLLGMNGRDHALLNDMLTAIRLDKRMVLLDVVGSLSKSGPPTGRSSEGTILNATAAFYNVFCPQGTNPSVRMTFGALCNKAVHETVSYARELLKAEV